MQEANPSSEVYWVDKLVTNSLIQLDGQSLQAKDKQVRGEGVTLPDGPAGHHFRERGSVPENMKMSGGDLISYKEDAKF